MRYAIVTIVVVILVAIFGTQSLYTQDETQLSVTTRFGQIKNVHTTPGLKLKVPFFENKNYFDKRLLRVDLAEASLPDVDTQFLNIDAYVRYHIGRREVVNGKVTVNPDDVRKFFETLGTLARADDRIERIVASALREEIAKRTREEVIGARVKAVVDVVDDPGAEINLEDAIVFKKDAQLGDDITVPTHTRQDILAIVLAESEKAVRNDQNGITIVEVRIKRADFPLDVQEDIFTRMRAERLELAQGFRADGQKEKDIIEADVDKRVAVIRAEAERDANITKGEGEANAIRILADALGQDPEFFAFRRSLEAYQKFLSQNSTIVLSSDADLFQYLDTTKALSASQRIATVGQLESRVGNLWVVGGLAVNVDGATNIRTVGDQAIGDLLFIEGAPQADNSVRATHVSSGLRGRLQGISDGDPSDAFQEWRVEGIDEIIFVGTNADVEVGADQVGLELLVGFQRQPDGSLQGLAIRVA